MAKLTPEQESEIDELIKTTSIAEWRKLNLIAFMLGNKTDEEYDDLDRWLFTQYHKQYPKRQIICRLWQS